MDVPKQRDYPDYYDVITNPIDMKEIRRKIENNKVYLTYFLNSFFCFLV